MVTSKGKIHTKKAKTVVKKTKTVAKKAKTAAKRAKTVARKARTVVGKTSHHFRRKKKDDEPWKLLIATIFLNKTNRKVALPLLEVFLKTYPTPEAVMAAEEPVLAALLQPMGLHNTRAHKLKRFTQEYERHEWIKPSELYGIGKYGEDSYRLFCLGDWRSVKPQDKELNKYHKWLLQSVNTGALCL